MARTRAQRRRTQVLVTLALVATVLVLAFSRDVSQAAHRSISPRRSENRSFAQLANGVILTANDLDARLAYLIQHGGTLARPVFGARLLQIAQALPTLYTDASQLRRPVLAHGVNATFVQVVEQRIDDDQTILDTVAAALQLPWTPVATTPQGWTVADASLVATAATWQTARFSLVREPGRVHLYAFTDAVASIPLAAAVATLTTSPRLVLTRAISISAVEIQPSPLPASPGTISLPPVTSAHLAVTITNDAYVTQPVQLAITLTPSGAGATQSQSFSATLGPLSSYGVAANDLALVPGTRATLRLVLSGAPAAPGRSTTRTYQVLVASSGALG